MSFALALLELEEGLHIIYLNISRPLQRSES